MKKWIVTLLIVLAIGTAAYTVNYWLPPLLAFADDNSVRIEAITNLTQMVLHQTVGRAWQMDPYRRF